MSIYKGYDFSCFDNRKKAMDAFLYKHWGRVLLLMDIVWWAESPREAFYCYKNNINDIPICHLDTCENKVLFRSGYTKYCCTSHSSLDARTRIDYNKRNEKSRKTCLERYGVENPAQSEEIKEKIKQTNLERYGSEFPTQSDKVKEKIKQTNLERYGCENPFSSDEIKEKIKQTNLSRYGVENPRQSEKIKEKIKQTNIERYGVEYISQADSVKETVKETMLSRYGGYTLQSYYLSQKVKNTNLERYGVKHPSLSPEIREKIKLTNIEKYGTENVFGNPDIREKIKQTNLERYGSEFPTQNDKVKENIKQTNLERYGVTNVACDKDIKEKIKATNIERYGCENPFSSEEIKEKIKATNIERYGCENAMQNFEIFSKSMRNSFRLKEYDAIDGNTIKIMGYEGYAYDWLTRKNISIEPCNKTHAIKYFDELGNKKIYFPDLYNKDNDLYYEVKTIFTLYKQLNKFKQVYKYTNKRLIFILYVDDPRVSDPILFEGIDQLVSIINKYNIEV